MTHHICCRECDFEALVEDDDEAGDKAWTHAEATGHRVASDSIDGGAEMVTDGGRKTAYRPPCDAVENWSSRAPWDRIERRVCPICRYYFDTKATSGQVFCGDACRQRHERGEFL